MTEEVAAEEIIEESTDDQLNDDGFEETEDFEDDAEDTEESDESEGSEDDDSEDVELEGKTYKVPKAIKSAVMMHADYTKKTQELADQRRNFEADRGEFVKHAQQQQALLQETAKVVALDDQIEQYRQVDWYSLSEQDPVKAQQLRFQLDQLKDAREQMARGVSQKEQQLALEAQQLIAKRIEESESVLKRDIKEWSPDLDNKLQQFAVDKFGFARDDAFNAKADHRLIKLLHLAYVGDQLLQKQASQKPKADIKPIKTVKSSSTKTMKDPTKMSDAEFAKWRREQIKKRSYS